MLPGPILIECIPTKGLIQITNNRCIRLVRVIVWRMMIAWVLPNVLLERTLNQSQELKELLLQVSVQVIFAMIQLIGRESICLKRRCAMPNRRVVLVKVYAPLMNTVGAIWNASSEQLVSLFQALSKLKSSSLPLKVFVMILHGQECNHQSSEHPELALAQTNATLEKVTVRPTLSAMLAWHARQLLPLD